MTLSDYIIEQFDLSTANEEKEFYEPYNTLLVEFFPANEHYQVSPHFRQNPESRYIDFFYVVSKRKVPIFFIEVSRSTSIDLENEYLLSLEDEQMRIRFLELLESIRIPKLYGLSALGTHFAVYELTTNSKRLFPDRIDHRFCIGSVAPETWWNYNILDPDGEAKFREIVAEIKEMTADASLGFQTLSLDDMNLSEIIIEQFSLIDLSTADDSDFYGPYNTLLANLFPAKEHYQVSPQFKRITGTSDITVLYTVSKRKVPVFFAEVKTLVALQNAFLRAKADEEMRMGFREFLESIRIPKLYGLSALGTHFSVYELTTENKRLRPYRIDPDPQFLTDRAPVTRWNYSILDPHGEAKLREIVEEIKQMAENL